VLARNGAAPIGDLRYLADTKLNNLATPIAKAQLAAALALVGDKARAEKVYGGGARRQLNAEAECSSSAAPITARRCATRQRWCRLPAKAMRHAPTLLRPSLRVEAARGLSPYTSTQENAWLVLAARAIAKEQRVALDVNGPGDQAGAVYRSYKAELT
jgi:uncharacterized protein YfaS (alpha-2-macroglobulin family)